MTLLLNGEKSSQFIRVSDNAKLKNKDILLTSVDLKAKIFKGKFYFLIKKFQSGKEKKEAEYQFDSIKIYHTIEQIKKKENHLCSFKLKVSESIKEKKNIYSKIPKAKQLK